MKFSIKLFTFCLALPLIVGGLSGLITSSSMDAFGMLSKPALSPPAYLFPIVWTLLYILMGAASYLILRTNASPTLTHAAFTFYLIQLAANFLWPIFFFTLEWYFFSFFWLLLLLILVIITILLFSKISKAAAYLMIPYLLWLIFAGYLNLAVALLN